LVFAAKLRTVPNDLVAILEGWNYGKVVTRSCLVRYTNLAICY
jgi:hypothetical protein